jgi:glycosyltransferase involved in cell wall biosynthesis
MKIAILVSQFPPKHLGGTEVATYNLARNFAKWGHSVHIITTWDEGLPEKSYEENFSIYRIKWKNPKIKIGVIGFFFNLFSNVFLIRFFFCWDVYKNIRKINPDIINCQQVHMGIQGFIAKKLLSIPYVIYGRGFSFSDIQSDIQSDIMNILSAKDPDLKIIKLLKKTVWLYKYALKRADAVIVLTENMKKLFEPDYPGKIFTIPNGIDLNRFERLSKKESRFDMNIISSEKIILCVSRLKYYKGIQYLIYAIAPVVKNHPDVMLYLIGDDQGEQQKILMLIHKLNLNNHVKFFGAIPNDETIKYMAAADIFVLPSLREGFPNVLLEAMAVGLPIICTNVDGLPEIVNNGQNGFLVDPENPEQISKNLEVLLDNKEIYDNISKFNIEYVKKYSIENTIKKLEDVYMSCIKTNIQQFE